jgi:hypothetical protein
MPHKCRELDRCPPNICGKNVSKEAEEGYFEARYFELGLVSHIKDTERLFGFTTKEISLTREFCKADGCSNSVKVTVR